MRADPTPADAAPVLAELARLVARHARADGVHETLVPGVCAVRRSQPQALCQHVLHQPAVCLIAQGSKQVQVGNETYAFDATRLLVLSVDLHVKGQVTEASRDRPYLCLRIQVDPAEIAALLLRMPPERVRREAPARGLYLNRASPPLLDAAARLLRAAEDPAEAALLGPLAVQEILFRLLTSEHGARLAHIARPDTNAHRIAQAIGWLKTHYAATMRVEALADLVHMSPSSLHHHFRAVTALSPLQYQKQLRLQEARRLLLGGRLDVAGAAHRVGYESASQFSRDYSRHFGAAPSHELQRLREVAETAAIE
jgi:AraC-like DNA-binding protein